MRCKPARAISLVILICLIIQTVYASDIDITADQLYISGIIGDISSASFEIQNTGSSNITGIEFSMLMPFVYGGHSIPDSNVVINSDLTLNLPAGTNSTVDFSIYLPGTIYPGNYTGIISASDGSEPVNLMLMLNAKQQDSAPPFVVSHAPSGKVTTSSVTLSITTNEYATCKYSGTSGITYDNMAGSFSSANSLTHSQTLSGLVDGTYHYYIKCKDMEGNIASSDYDATFTLDTYPKAQVTLSDSSPVKAGTVEITLKTSEVVQSTPYLAYSFDGSSFVYIPLVGSGTSWTGYIIIPENTGHKVVSFRFSGTDLLGHSGNTITSGGIFIIDTEEPSQILSVESTSDENGNIKLSWYFNEEADSYNIYRSTLKGVDYTDFYENTDDKSFTDYDVESGETYYYKVTAEDEAENEGPLSKEVYATAIIGKVFQSDNNEEPKLSTALIGSVDNLIKKIDDILKSADKTLLNFDSSNQKNIVEELDLPKSIVEGKTELNNLKSELENLKSQDLTRVELEKKLKRIELNIKVTKQQIPESIIIIQEKDYTNHVTINDLKKLVNEIHEELTNDEKDDYIKQNKYLLDKLDVRTNAKIISIGYMDGIEKELTFIHKEISKEEISEKTNVIEIIPKTVAESVDDIDFKTSNYEILEEDPILEWSGTNSITYTLDGKIDLDEIGKIKMILLIPFSWAEEENSDNATDSITGFASLGVFSKFNSLGIIIGLLAIICLSIYYFIFVKKYFKNVMILENILKKVRREKDQTSSNKEIYELLKQAHNHLDKGMLDMASNTYNLISTNYALLEESDEKNNVHIDVVELCNRIDSYHLEGLISEAQIFLKNNKTKEASIIYENMKTIYKRLPEKFQTEFNEKYSEISTQVKKGIFI